MQEENKLIHIDHRLVTAEENIHRLKKQREKLQFQQALLFFKETQKIFDKAFAPDLALFVLKDVWAKASEAQKEKWQHDRGQEGEDKNISESQNPHGADSKERGAGITHYDHEENQKNKQENQQTCSTDFPSKVGRPLRDVLPPGSHKTDPSPEPTYYPS